MLNPCNRLTLPACIDDTIILQRVLAFACCYQADDNSSWYIRTVPALLFVLTYCIIPTYDDACSGW